MMERPEENGVRVATDEPHNSGLAGRYASALFELAQEEKSLPAVEKDLATLKTMIGESADLLRLVRAPVFSNEEQSKGMNAILHRMEASALTRRFILLLTSKRRLFVLNDIIRAFQGLAARHRGEIRATVTSARALSDAQTKALKDALKSELGREASLDVNVDPNLLGGLVVKVGSKMIDSSLRTKLNGIRAAMRGN